MRNSSLVKRFCAENVTGLKSAAEAAGVDLPRKIDAVGERSKRSEGLRKRGLERLEVSMPELVTINAVKNRIAVSPRVHWAMLISPG